MTACGGGGGGGGSTPPDGDIDKIDDTPDFTITSENYTDGGEIPLLHACESLGGANVSPQYTWSNPPIVDDLGNTIATYVIFMEDETPPCGTGANACVHWVVVNMPPQLTSLISDVDFSVLIEENPMWLAYPKEGYSYIPTIDYEGPCPSSAHTYITTVYAIHPTLHYHGSYLGTSSQFEEDNADAIIGKAQITGTFTP